MTASRESQIGMPLKDIYTWLSVGGSLNIKSKRLLKSYGIDADDDASRIISADECWRLFTEHAALVDDEWQNAMGDRLRTGGTNLIVAGMLLCENIFDAIKAYAGSWKILNSDTQISVNRRASGLSLRWSGREEATESQAIILEGTATAFYALFCWMADDDLKVLRTVSASVRENSDSTLLKIMGAPIVYKGGDIEIVFSPTVADARIKNKALEKWRDGVHSFYKRLIELRTSETPSGELTTRVKALLQTGHDQTEIADALKLSTRTLARRLSMEGRSFRDIANEVKCQRATSLIHAGLTVESISEQLGYEDTRSFRRAFRRWMGTSASQYRDTFCS